MEPGKRGNGFPSLVRVRVKNPGGNWAWTGTLGHGWPLVGLLLLGFGLAGISSARGRNEILLRTPKNGVEPGGPSAWVTKAWVGCPGDQGLGQKALGPWRVGNCAGAVCPGRIWAKNGRHFQFFLSRERFRILTSGRNGSPGLKGIHPGGPGFFKPNGKLSCGEKPERGHFPLNRTGEPLGLWVRYTGGLENSPFFLLTRIWVPRGSTKYHKVPPWVRKTPLGAHFGDSFTEGLSRGLGHRGYTGVKF